jgi:hypothetical protein
LIEEAVHYLHRNYTRDGKIRNIPKKLEVVDSVLQLEIKLKEAGIDTSQMKDNIQKASVKISQQLNDLLGDESRVKVNEIVYSIGSEQEKRYIKQAELLLLEESNPEKADDHPEK